MVAPILRVTIQAASLNALSNVLAQLITSYRTGTPFALDLHNLIAFVTFSLIASPPNYLWQTWLEATFPGYTDSLTPPEKEKLIKNVVGQSSAIDSQSSVRAREGKKLAMTENSTSTPSKKKKLNYKNTLIKFLLDQSFGAAANTVLFIFGIALLQGRTVEAGIQECKDGFYPLIRAGQRLWPLVSIINLTFVPVEKRMIFGSIVGVFWGIFLSLLSDKKKTA